MGGYLYLIVLIFIALVAFWNFYIGEHTIDRTLSCICIISFSVLSIYLFYTSVNAIDSVSYETKFKYVDTLSVSVDYLFVSFVKLVKSFTDDYQIFRGKIGCIYLMPIFLILYKERVNNFNRALFLLLCLLYPFFQSIVALRFTMASSITILALYLYLKSKRTRKGVIITSAVLLAAALIHDTTIIYFFLFVFFQIYKKTNNKKMIAVGIILVDFIIIAFLRIGVISNIVNTMIGETNSFYLEIMKNARLGFLISVFFHLGFVFLLNRAIQNGADTGQGKEMNQDIMILNYSSLIIVPLYSINVLSFRLFRGILLLDFLVFAKCYCNKKKDTILLMLIVLEVACMLFDANGMGSIVSILMG